MSEDHCTEMPKNEVYKDRGKGYMGNREFFSGMIFKNIYYLGWIEKVVK